MLLVFAAVIGVVVSLASWAFLELINQIQIGVFTDLPGDLGFNTVPWWWPLPVLFLAGFPVAFAIARLPGGGGHIPANGLQMGTTEPNMVPGVVLAALATIGLGLVLGPEAPLIALGGGLAVFSVKLAKKDAPPQLLVVLGAAGGFAAISAIFGSPIVAAILVIEAAGLGGATLPLIVLPGLMAAGIGSLVFIGMGDWTGLSTSAYSLTPLHLSRIRASDLGADRLDHRDRPRRRRRDHPRPTARARNRGIRAEEAVRDHPAQWDSSSPRSRSCSTRSPTRA